MTPIPLGILAAAGIAAADFKLIATATSTGSQTLLQITNIPQNFRHLVIHANFRSNASFTDDNLMMRLNGSTSTYRRFASYGRQTSYSTDNNTSTELQIFRMPAAQELSAQFGPSIIEIPNYSSASLYKTVRSMSGSETSLSSGYIGWAGGVAPFLDPVTSLSFRSGTSASFASGSRISVYGLVG